LWVSALHSRAVVSVGDCGRNLHLSVHVFPLHLLECQVTAHCGCQGWWVVCVCVCVCLCVCVYVYVYVCICVCVRVHVCIDVWVVLILLVTRNVREVYPQAGGP